MLKGTFTLCVMSVTAICLIVVGYIANDKSKTLLGVETAAIGVVLSILVNLGWILQTLATK